MTDNENRLRCLFYVNSEYEARVVHPCREKRLFASPLAPAVCRSQTISPAVKDWRGYPSQRVQYLESAYRQNKSTFTRLDRIQGITV